MAASILSFVHSLSQLTVHQAWILFVFIVSELLLAYFGREVYRRCD